MSAAQEGACKQKAKAVRRCARETMFFATVAAAGVSPGGGELTVARSRRVVRATRGTACFVYTPSVKLVGREG